MLARLFPHEAAVGQRTGKPGGGALLDQSVLTRPEFVSWKETVPALTAASGVLPRPSVVQASVNALPFELCTVTFSSVGVVW